MKGIYQIKNIVNNKIYVGSSVNIKDRWYGHKNLLNKNSHENNRLQNAWNKYGEQNFIFEIIEETDNILEREQFWMDCLDSHNRNIGYNICPTAQVMGKFVRSKKWIVIFPTGEEISITDIHDFCRNNEDSLDPSSMLKVARGKLNQHKGYKVRPEGVSLEDWKKNKTRKDKTGQPSHWQGQWQVKHPDGKIEIVDALVEFCRKYNLDESNLWITAYNDKRFSHKGFSCIRHDGISEFREKPIIYKFIITLPDKTEIVIDNLSKFCKDNNLSYPDMIQTRTKGYQHKGFSCRQIGKEPVQPKGRGKTYLVITPDGEEITVQNLAKFSVNLGLKKGCLNDISRTGGTYKGYRCQKITENNNV